jgi:HPt (histidine-containing phosphotransfer) domain-containing protein
MPRSKQFFSVIILQQLSFRRDPEIGPCTGDRADPRKGAAAIDRDVLAAWLGEDRAAIDSLLGKFRETAIETEREIDAASRTGNLATLAAAAHKLKGAAQAVGATALAPPQRRWSRRAKLATGHTAVTCSVRSRCNCVMHLLKSKRPAHRHDPGQAPDTNDTKSMPRDIARKWKAVMVLELPHVR